MTAMLAGAAATLYWEDRAYRSSLSKRGQIAYCPLRMAVKPISLSGGVEEARGPLSGRAICWSIAELP